MPMLDRRRFRWLNGAGVALTLFFAAWLVYYLLALISAGFRGFALPMPIPHAIVGGLALVAMIAFLSILLIGYVAQRADLSHGKPRHYLFAWTCAAALFCASQSIVVLQRGAEAFSNVPGWSSTAYWYFAVVGALVFLVLLWVNAEGVTAHEVDDYDPDDEYDDEPLGEYEPQHVDDLD